MPPLSRAVPTFLAAVAAAVAQCPPGAPMPQDLSLETNVAEAGAARVRWQTAQDALKSGDLAAAQKHLLAALEFHPSAPALLLDLAIACRADAALAPLWAERFVRAASDAQGKLKLDPAARKQLAAIAGFEASLKPALDLATARAAAIAELAKFVDKHKPAGKQNAPRAVLVRWAAEALLEAGLGAPAALAAAAPAVDRVQDAFEPDYDLVFQALARVMQKKVPAKPANGVPLTGADAEAATVQDQRNRAARILVGLRRQGAFTDLKGPPPRDVGKAADDAQRLLDEQAAAAAAEQKVWTIAELEAMAPPAAEAFTQAHREWHAPGIATSSTGRYRIETICGHHTLLQVAKTIELHHARLVDHFGSDPFLQRQGLVRIVPESSDLETEGSPYWWAGGFQSGDRTTVRFAWGKIPELGRTLTHELTHRFDGVLRPFLGAWYGEGHAQWTAGHYGPMAAKQFVELYLDPDAPAHTWYKGYGGREKFEQLLTGKIADYRDNYFAGYSLYAFLRSFPPQAPRYRDVLEKYEKNARGGQKDPIAWFTTVFCDGKQGRPATLDELFVDWQEFLRGCYDAADPKKPRAVWLAGYRDRGDGDPASLVMDPPTWSWARKRAEPFFGQDHAAAATLLLHEVGDLDGTVAAGVWSLTVDGWRPDTAGAVLAALRAGKSPEAAQAFGTVARRHFPQLPGGEATQLLAALPRTKALLDALAERATALAPQARTAAAALIADHGRLAPLFAQPALRDLAAGAPPLLPRHLGGHGFTESSLTDFEDRRVKGLWYATADGDLHVGRERPRESTGTLDREAHQRDAFVHTVAWQAPGCYVLRGRVHFTTSYASGAIVFGHTRRDRCLRLSFSSGDFDYATGRSERNDSPGSVGLHLHGLWERDGQLPETNQRRSVDITADAPWFDYVLHVRGPRVLVEINGERLFSYSVHDGTPIEGHVGFAMGMGAIRVQQPTVQRRDGEPEQLMAGLSIDTQPDHGLDELLMLPTRGIPLGPDGTLVMWLPRLPEDEPVALERALPSLARLLNTPHEYPQQWVLAVPKELPAAARAAASALIADVRKQPLPVVEHMVGEPFDGRYPWVLFVDSQGVLRAAAGANDPDLQSKVVGWSRKYRRREG